MIQDDKLKTIPIEKLEQMATLMKKVRSLEGKSSKLYKKLDLSFTREIKRRKNE